MRALYKVRLHYNIHTNNASYAAPSGDNDLAAQPRCEHSVDMLDEPVITACCSNTSSPELESMYLSKE